jgi:hypothetical protein
MTALWNQNFYGFTYLNLLTLFYLKKFLKPANIKSATLTVKTSSSLIFSSGQHIMHFGIYLLLAVPAVFASDNERPSFAGDETRFATFASNNRSYAMVFRSVIGDSLRDHDSHCNGRLHNAPTPLFDALMEECATYGKIDATVETEQPTNQLLVASPYYNCGQDFIYTDKIDKDEEMLAVY